MSELVVASSEADAHAAEAVRHHHASHARRARGHLGAAARGGAARGLRGRNTQEADGPESPELDARSIPHAIRHATILGALDAVLPDAGLALTVAHDPLPLLAQMEQRWP